MYDTADAAGSHDLLGRQIRLLDLCTLKKSWLKPVKKLLYAAPLVDSDARALTLLHHLRRYPENAQLVRRLQFGEGSSNDTISWTSPDLIPALIIACPCLEHLNFGVLGNTDPAKIFDALSQCKLLRHLGFHGKPDQLLFRAISRPNSPTTIDALPYRRPCCCMVIVTFD